MAGSKVLATAAWGGTDGDVVGKSVGEGDGSNVGEAEGKGDRRNVVEAEERVKGAMSEWPRELATEPQGRVMVIWCGRGPARVQEGEINRLQTTLSGSSVLIALAATNCIVHVGYS